MFIISVRPLWTYVNNRTFFSWTGVRTNRDTRTRRSPGTQILLLSVDLIVAIQAANWDWKEFAAMTLDPGWNRDSASLAGIILGHTPITIAYLCAQHRRLYHYAVAVWVGHTTYSARLSEVLAFGGWGCYDLKEAAVRGRGVNEAGATAVSKGKPGKAGKAWAIVPGLVLCLAIAAVATLLGTRFPLIGGPIFSILLGLLAGNMITLPAVVSPGIRFASKKVLQAAIVVLGGSLSLGQVWRTGVDSLAVMLTTLGVALASAWLLGKGLRVSSNLTTLVGVGTGICGGSAIAAVAPIVQADDDEIAFSISTVFLFNVIAVLVFPLMGRLLGLDDSSFGLWAGTAINDTSAVVAAGYSYSQVAGEYATIVKLTRTTMIIPISIFLAFLAGRRKGQAKYDVKQVFPWFIIAFVAASVLNTTGVLGPVVPALLGQSGKLLIVVALAGVGLGADIAKMIKIGPRPILLGLAMWVLVAGTSLLVQALSGQL